MCAEFEGNPIMCFCYGGFCKCAIEEKKELKKIEESKQLFQGPYLSNGWCDLLQI